MKCPYYIKSIVPLKNGRTLLSFSSVIVAARIIFCVSILAAGIVPSPYDCFLVIRSLKTLAVRMEQHMKNAVEVASFLEGHPLVERVIFPGM